MELFEIMCWFPKNLVARIFTQPKSIGHLTETVVCSTLQFQTEDLVAQLLNKICGEHRVTRAILTAAAQNLYGLSPETFASLLDKREDTLNELSESVLAAAVENKVCPK